LSPTVTQLVFPKNPAGYRNSRLTIQVLNHWKAYQNVIGGTLYSAVAYLNMKSPTASQRRYMNWIENSLLLKSGKILIGSIVCILFILCTPVFPQSDVFPENSAFISKIDAKTNRLLKSLPAESSMAFWVLFKDKGVYNPAQYKIALDHSASLLSNRSLNRRALRGASVSLDFTDIPVKTEYIEQLKSLGVEIRIISKWLNAVSILANREQVEKIIRLPFVQEIKPVAKFSRRKLEIESRQPDKLGKLLEGNSLGYGQSYDQLAQIHVPDFHRIGITGKGVLLTLMDTGFFIHHPCFEHILDSGRLLAMRDFINNDENVEDEDDRQRSHGTSVWSVVGGFVDNTIIGAAYGAEFALAKTEIDTTEIQIEEDYWVAGVEWADSIGTDIVSTSLGYNDWYTYEDMDGNTALCTIAADLAVSKGIVVVNAAGNERVYPWYHIIAPADGDSVIAAGAVDLLGNVAIFSSAGPTYDGRIKPDVMALGVGNFCATRSGGYDYSQGTSFATPLVAGACALLLEANPDWTPVQLREALWTTASQAENPDNLMGYGIVNASKASGFDYLITSPENLSFEVSFGDTQSERATVEIAEWRGKNLEWKVTSKPDWITVFPDSAMTPELFWVTVNPYGLKAGSNESQIEISADSAINSPYKIPVSFTIHPTVPVLAFPNPFTDSLTVLIKESDFPRKIKIEVFTTAGELVYRFPEDNRQDMYQHTWNGRNENGEEVAGGVYLLKMDIGGDSQIKKIAKVK
jgi:serine protease AprX